jgi:hypothetical protein
MESVRIVESIGKPIPLEKFALPIYAKKTRCCCQMVHVSYAKTTHIQTLNKGYVLMMVAMKRK